MKDRKVTNVAASVRQRLLNAAQASGRPFQEVLQYFAMERFLYRLTKSPHADRFVLKGALMFNVWGAATARSTRDIDLLGRMENSVPALEATLRDVCRQATEPDGLVFDPNTVAGSIIKENADYEGVRVTFLGVLENARIPMQIDIGFGDVMFPEPEITDYPTILGHDAPKLRAYSRETVVAEKFEAMVKLGISNSRMKDFYDIWLMSRQFDFQGARLATAIERTFANRQTAVSAEPVALSPAFGTDPAKVIQWQAFLKKSNLAGVSTDLATVIGAIFTFLSPLASAVIEKRSFDQIWRAPGPWST